MEDLEVHQDTRQEEQTNESNTCCKEPQETVNLDDKYALVFVQASAARRTKRQACSLADGFLHSACCMSLSPMQTARSAHTTACLVEMLKVSTGWHKLLQVTPMQYL